MEYLTTNKHPELKKGIKITEYSGHASFSSGSDDINFSYVIIENWLDKGYIKEVEEKEFFPSDMVAFARWYSNHSEFEVSGAEILNFWLKQRNK